MGKWDERKIDRRFSIKVHQKCIALQNKVEAFFSVAQEDFCRVNSHAESPSLFYPTEKRISINPGN